MQKRARELHEPNISAHIRSSSPLHAVSLTKAFFSLLSLHLVVCLLSISQNAFSRALLCCSSCSDTRFCRCPGNQHLDDQDSQGPRFPNHRKWQLCLGFILLPHGNCSFEHYCSIHSGALDGLPLLRRLYSPSTFQGTLHRSGHIFGTSSRWMDCCCWMGSHRDYRQRDRAVFRQHPMARRCLLLDRPGPRHYYDHHRHASSRRSRQG
ncbi:hypothetical protein M408DRAFT_216540 [Serendipita vermifera MAFF 305830]|uniref:Uncharacterized protein n=1 Tax=Serendipita vermifera MAFF 305830 TaxID=933852 RepID=A0A0C3BLG4_SERVB|nr:hypothetical protein M408DRAFT_216540 [Serendipita vermifera MAFF 305830]